LSNLKLDKVDKPVPNEFDVLNTFKPDIYNDPFIFVVLSKLVNPLTFNEDNIVVLLFEVVKPPIFHDVINVALSLTSNSFKSENPLTFKFENIVILSDVILFASISFKPVEDKPQQSISYIIT
jgi:hypothetical protein